MSIKLDNIQEDIVNSNAQDIVVVAGAGSGKTRVLTERIRKLLNDGVNPASIVAITFTNMAAEEMTQRLSDIPNYHKMFIGTIHSFANMILRRYSSINYQLLTDEAETYIVKELCKSPQFYFTFAMYCDFKSQHYDSGKVYNYITRKYGFQISKSMRHILECEPNDEYTVTISSYAKTHNYISFDELIEICSDYLKDNNLIIDYLFVDEFQDIGSLEYNFIKALNANHNFMVGDDYQAIYGFKGATDVYFKRLLNNSYWKSYMLTNNYRCGEKIINLGNRIISNILEGEELKPAICKSNLPGYVKYLSNTRIIPNIIKNSKDEYKDWFILCRTNKEIEEITKLLNDKNIPNCTFKKFEMSFDEMKSLLDDNKVKVITTHSAKGLESKNVIIAYMNPLSSGRIYDRNGNIRSPEEVKLYYVAITRAKENLYIL